MNETLVFATWTDVPEHIRSHCMLHVAKGVMRHIRLGLCLVILDQANTSEGMDVLMQEIGSKV